MCVRVRMCLYMCACVCMLFYVWVCMCLDVFVEGEGDVFGTFSWFGVWGWC